MKKYIAEFLGTFWLVLGGCGSAVISAAYTETSFQSAAGENVSLDSGIGVLGVAIAFGLTVVSGAYAFGHISGGHFNPAVSFGLFVGKRFPGGDLLPYIIAQVVGAIVAGVVIYFIASGESSFIINTNDANPLAVNGYGKHSPDGYGLIPALITEIIMTFMFLMVILGITDRRAPAGFAPLAIGLALILIHLISIPVTNTSVNPARSTGVALLTLNAEIIGQLWLFWVAPILGGVLAGLVSSSVFEESEQ